MHDRPTHRRIRSIITIGIVLAGCVGILVYVGWALFEMVTIARISNPSTTLKLMFLGLIFGLLGVVMQRRGRRRR